MLMTIVQELIEVGVTSEERFETLLTRHLAQVDQAQSETRDGLRTMVMEQFYKTKEPPEPS
jgi:hypothetical protein